MAEYFVSVRKDMIRSSRSFFAGKRSWFDLFYKRFFKHKSYLQQLCDQYNSFYEFQIGVRFHNVDGFPVKGNDPLTAQSLIKYNPDFNKDRMFGYVYFNEFNN